MDLELPATDEEWQSLVDECEGAIALDAAQKYGLVTGGPEVNVERCLAYLKLGAKRGFHPRADAPQRYALALLDPRGRCQVCGCTDDNCGQCIAKTGAPCHWVNEQHTLCSACVRASLELALESEAAA
jgi:hypothetical protein